MLEFEVRHWDHQQRGMNRARRPGSLQETVLRHHGRRSAGNCPFSQETRPGYRGSVIKEHREDLNRTYRSSLRFHRAIGAMMVVIRQASVLRKYFRSSLNFRRPCRTVVPCSPIHYRRPGWTFITSVWTSSDSWAAFSSPESPWLLRISSCANSLPSIRNVNCDLDGPPTPRGSLWGAFRHQLLVGLV